MRLFYNKIWALFMSPFSLIYGGIIAIRNLFYDWGWFSIHQVSVPVISVGNLTVGGVGKTPLTLWLVKFLMNQGLRVGIVSRGYGRISKGFVAISDGEQILIDSQNGGDEPLMMAQICPEAIVAVCEDRVTAAQKIIEMYDVQVIVLDDAYQNRRLHRDLNLAVIHAKQGFGNGSILPGGPLRESRAGLKRADVIVLSHYDDKNVLSKQMEALQKLKLPVVKTTHQAIGWIDDLGKTYPINHLNGKRVVAFSGIANPDTFFQTLSELNVVVIKKKRFKDHHAFSNSEIKEMEQLAFIHKADAIVMTQKDKVKLSKETPVKIKNYALCIELKLISNQNILENMIESIVKTEGGSYEQ